MVLFYLVELFAFFPWSYHLFYGIVFFAQDFLFPVNVKVVLFLLLVRTLLSHFTITTLIKRRDWCEIGSLNGVNLIERF